MAGDLIEQGVAPVAAAAPSPATSGSQTTDLDNVVTTYLSFVIDEKTYRIKREIPFRIGLEIMALQGRQSELRKQVNAIREEAEATARKEGKTDAEIRAAGNMAVGNSPVSDAGAKMLEESFDLLASVFRKAKPEPLTADQLKDMLSFQSVQKLIEVLSENVFKMEGDAGSPLAEGAAGQ